MWLFASDLHGRIDRYRTLLDVIVRERPAAVLLGGDLLPSGLIAGARPGEPAAFEAEETPFISGFLARAFAAVRDQLGPAYPRVFLILGNDDPRSAERELREAGAVGLWEDLHERRSTCEGVDVFGYACVPPTPFLLKDWERYDVSRYVDPGCCSPEEGWRTVDVEPNEVKFATIKDDLARVAGNTPLDRSVWLFHAPPHDTVLDRAALDGVMVDHAPLDVHVGSIAIRRFIEARQPLVTLHGHVHESARLTGRWRQQIGRTHALSAAHDGPELALVRVDPKRPEAATRELI